MQPDNDKVTRLPVQRRLRVINPPTPLQQAHGIATELHELAGRRFIPPGELRALTNRLEAVLDRLAGGGDAAE